MGEEVEKMASHNVENIYGQSCRVQIMQSEQGAAGALHGALVAGLSFDSFAIRLL